MDADLEIPDLRFEDRAQRFWPVARRCLARVYADRPDLDAWLERISDQVRAYAAARPEELRAHDRRREAQGEWWAQGRTVGYSAYVDRFAGELRQMSGRLGYLGELGVSYLHLLPLLKAREGENDGGFAVSDFGVVEPRLGTTDDLREFARDARAAGISLVVDLVCNHTSDDHAWAKAARSGDERRRAYYLVLPDAEAVRRCEQTLTDVFPEVAPGNFTYCEEMGGWVWTTFYPFQWDLNYANPAVFCEMLGAMLGLANLGVDGLRLDSAPFLWKRVGTDCRNQPEVHLLLAAWRALLSIVAPSVALKAEAIERLEEVTAYFGADPAAPECQLAYNNGAMTSLWASLALGSAEPARRLIEAAAAKPAWGAWVNYVRCHDDIIWSALTPYLSVEEQARCSRFFAGLDKASFSAAAASRAPDGAPASTNGMTAGLVGVADDDPDSPAARRLLLLYGVTYALDGLPVVWMGDEIALGDNLEVRQDGRWLQRPVMDWRRAADRGDPGRLPGRVFQRLALLGRLRAAFPAFDARHVATPTATEDPAVLSFLRGEAPDHVQCIANFAGEPRVARAALSPDGGAWADLLSRDTGQGPKVELGPYQVRWLITRR